AEGFGRWSIPPKGGTTNFFSEEKPDETQKLFLDHSSLVEPAVGAHDHLRPGHAGRLRTRGQATRQAAGAGRQRARTRQLDWPDRPLLVSQISQRRRRVRAGERGDARQRPGLRSRKAGGGACFGGEREVRGAEAAVPVDYVRRRRARAGVRRRRFDVALQPFRLWLQEDRRGAGKSVRVRAARRRA